MKTKGAVEQNGINMETRRPGGKRRGSIDVLVLSRSIEKKGKMDAKGGDGNRNVPHGRSRSMFVLDILCIRSINLVRL